MNRGVSDMRKLLLALPLVLAACGGNPSGEKVAQAPKEKGIPLPDVNNLPPEARKRMGNIKANAEIMRMRQVAGRWQSQPGALGTPGQWLTIDIANNRKFSLEQRGAMGKMEAVYATSNGSLEWTPEGLVNAKTPGAKNGIARFSSWSASFPGPGKMLVKASDGKTVEMSYRGL